MLTYKHDCRVTKCCGNFHNKRKKHKLYLIVYHKCILYGYKTNCDIKKKCVLIVFILD